MFTSDCVSFSDGACLMCYSPLEGPCSSISTMPAPVQPSLCFPALQLSCTTIVWPSLILTYLGQAAFLTKHPNEVSQTYFQSLPHDVFWPMFVIASLSAVIASQVGRLAYLCDWIPRRSVTHRVTSQVWPGLAGSECRFVLLVVNQSGRIAKCHGSRAEAACNSLLFCFPTHAGLPCDYICAAHCRRSFRRCSASSSRPSRRASSHASTSPTPPTQ